MSIRSSVFFLGLVTATLLAPSIASADDLRDCAAAYEQTQRLQQKSELLSAMDAANQCAKPVCPALLRDDCTKWAAELSTKIPSIVLHVRGGDGCARPEARVTIDAPSRKGEGAALLVDPGTHEITVVDPRTNSSRTQTFNLVSGEKRDIDVDFARPGAVCPRPQESTPIGRVPTISLIAGTVGAGFVLVGAGLGIVGATKRSDLDDCKPFCSADRVDSVRPFFIAGDIVAGVGVLALALGAISYFALQPKKHTPTTGSNTGSSTQWYFGPTGAGATF